MSNAMIVSQTSTLAKALSITGDPAELVSVLKATAFRGQVSDAQMTALLVVANQYGLNPWTKEIYAFPDKNNGIVPVVGVDGWARIINQHPQFDGMDFQQDDQSCTCTIYRKDRTRPVSVTEWMAECRREGVGPWRSHPRRMLRHKATIQCARLAFGFVGIYELDEAERIIEGEAAVVRQSRHALPAPEESAERDQAHADAAHAAGGGYAALESWWKNPANEGKRKLIADMLPALKDAAKKADDERTIEQEAA